MPHILAAPREEPAPESEGQHVDQQETDWYCDELDAGAAHDSNSLNGGYEDEGTDLYGADGGYDEGLDADEQEEVDAQDACYAALLQRFSKFRLSIRNRPHRAHSKANSRLLAAVAVATNARSKHSDWNAALLQNAPVTAHIASLPQEVVISTISRLQTLLIKGLLLKPDYGKNVGAWAWALLAQCREVGEMSSEEVAIIRQLGQRACKVRAKMRPRKIRSNLTEEVRSESTEGLREDLEIEDGGERDPGEIGQEKAELGKPITEEASQEVEEGEINEDGVNVMDVDGEADVVDKTNAITEESAAGTAIIPKLTEKATSTAETIHVELAKRRALLQLAIESAKGTAEPMMGDKGGSRDMEALHLPGSSSSGRSFPTADRISAGNSGVAQVSDPAGIEKENGRDTSVDQESRSRALATLDIITTIVGEIYGQRDLLDAREIWGEFE